MRNVAGIVPPFESDDGHRGTSAALAFAVVQLNVAEIVALGHAQCGGIAAALDNRLVKGVPFLGAWIDLLDPALEHSAHIHDTAERHTAMERDCVRLSLDNLMTFPFVAERVNAGAARRSAAPVSASPTAKLARCSTPTPRRHSSPVVGPWPFPSSRPSSLILRGAQAR